MSEAKPIAGQTCPIEAAHGPGWLGKGKRESRLCILRSSTSVSGADDGQPFGILVCTMRRWATLAGVQLL